MFAARVEGMTPFIVMEVLERAKAMEREGIRVIHLEVGEPDFDAPECVKEAIVKALADGHTHYTHSLGMPELRRPSARIMVGSTGWMCIRTRL